MAEKITQRQSVLKNKNKNVQKSQLFDTKLLHISITGFDDNESVSHTFPPLTTTRFDKIKLAERSIARLMAKINRKSKQSTVERIPVELVVRESVKKIQEFAMKNIFLVGLKKRFFRRRKFLKLNFYHGGS